MVSDVTQQPHVAVHTVKAWLFSNQCELWQGNWLQSGSSGFKKSRQRREAEDPALGGEVSRSGGSKERTLTRSLVYPPLSRHLPLPA